MFRIIEATMSKTRKINVGNYESVDIFVSAKAELTEGTRTELNQVHKELSASLDEFLEVEIKEVVDGKFNKKGATP